MLQETLYIEGMSCGHCVQQVKNIIEKQTGVIQAEVNLTEKQASVKFDEKATSLDIIKSAINQSELFKTK
ncbi:MAG: heavy-metal-associated domain-containing protein [Bacteroidetes bacterium]|nr:copper chaperone [Bacteroidota bacterium]MBV6460896.1 Copper chaperone CopZ [Flavobacteriales bacterium]WKZ75705.1 MAG: cation transporter [Vicingaceae bacterium]MCL4815272.1 heavy-metal-associated domain-containing protein [Flavobacteriales bacterium]NOG94614.1 heavy-metal-associated domain-containing protein [Bacteroidota bacterium]